MAPTPEEELAASIAESFLGEKASSDGTPQPSPSPEPKPEAKVEPEEEGESEAPTEEEKAQLTLDLSDPAKAAEVLISHPVISRELQRWADKAAANQVRAALKERDTASKEIAAEKTLTDWDTYFSTLSREELAEVRADPETDAIYVQVQSWKANRPDPVQTAIRRVYAGQVGVYAKMLESSELPPEKREELKPEHFTHLGPQGLFAWGQAIMEAIIDQRTTVKAGTKQKAKQQEELAAQDGERPPEPVPGRTGAPVLDLITSDSSVLMEAALTNRPPDKVSSAKPK